MLAQGAQSRPGATAFASLLDTQPGPEVDRAHAAVGPDTIAKFLFTLGFHRRAQGRDQHLSACWCANQQMIAQLWPFVAAAPPVIVDWLPWSHTFGANHNFNLVLRHGGTLYIDDGKPAPGLIDKTVANLKEIAPTIYFNVPRGFDMLLPFLERDAGLRDRFFSRLQMIFIRRGGAAAGVVGAPGKPVGRRTRRARADGVGVGRDRNFADGHTACISRSNAPASSACPRRAAKSRWCKTASSWN